MDGVVFYSIGRLDLISWKSQLAMTYEVMLDFRKLKKTFFLYLFWMLTMARLHMNGSFVTYRQVFNALVT